MKAVVALICLVLATPAGSYQGVYPATEIKLPQATAPDLSAIPESYRGIIAGAASATGVPVLILAGIAFAESGFRPAPAHCDPLDKGMFGLREVYHDERAKLYGEYDPEVPEQAAMVAAGILADHYERLGSWPMAIAAYHQGAGGVKANGIKWAYVDRVLSI